MNDFAEFWSLFPRRVSKRAAQKAWDKEMKAGTDPALIIAGLRRQLPHFATRDEQFIPHAATWLNQGRFEDEISPPQRAIPQRRAGDMSDYTRDLMEQFNDRTSSLSTRRDLIASDALDGAPYSRSH
jgi:hypothetical protein